MQRVRAETADGSHSDGRDAGAPRFLRPCRPKPCGLPSRRGLAASRRDRRRQPLRRQGRRSTAVPPPLPSKTLRSAVSAWTRGIAPRPQTAATQTAGTQEHRSSSAPAVYNPAVCRLGVDPRHRAETADGSHSDGRDAGAPQFLRPCRLKPCGLPSRRGPAASRRDRRRQPLRRQGRRSTAVPPPLPSKTLRSAVSAWPRGIAPRRQTAATQTAGTEEQRRVTCATASTRTPPPP